MIRIFMFAYGLVTGWVLRKLYDKKKRGELW